MMNTSSGLLLDVSEWEADQSGASIMKLYVEKPESKSAPALRVVYGDEAVKAVEMTMDNRRPSLRLNVEAEQYWAGRFPAARLSTRVAA